MKLAEALIERADLQRRLEEVRQRLVRNAKFQEGDSPSEDAQSLLVEYDRLSGRLEHLIVQINLTNDRTHLEDGTPLVAALARRDILKQRHSTYKALAEAATPRQDRYSKSEIRFLSAVDVSRVQTESDRIAKACRELDTKIQQANWNTDLI